MMSSIEYSIWGREFNLKIEYDAYDDEEITENQQAALADFIKAQNPALNDAAAIKEYCLRTDSERFLEGTIDNIFRYVIPEYIYIRRDEDTHLVALMCDYRFDEENGIAIVFENEKLKEIGSQDIIL